MREYFVPESAAAWGARDFTWTAALYLRGARRTAPSRAEQPAGAPGVETDPFRYPPGRAVDQPQSCPGCPSARTAACAPRGLGDAPVLIARTPT